MKEDEHLIASRIASIVSLAVERPGFIRAAVTWKRFSITSFRMVDDLRRQNIRPNTIVDVGGNVGQFTCAALQLLCPRMVHVFEPLPDAVAELRRHFGKDPRVSIHPVALGARTAELPLKVNAHSHSSSFLPLGSGHRSAFPTATTVGVRTVPVRTLDDELKDAKLEGPLLIKIDVQGYEQWVLEGGPATLECAEWVILEVSFRSLYDGEPLFLDLIADMGSRGFRFVRPVGWLMAPSTSEILQCDAMFVRAVEERR